MLENTGPAGVSARRRIRVAESGTPDTSAEEAAGSGRGPASAQAAPPALCCTVSEAGVFAAGARIRRSPAPPPQGSNRASSPAATSRGARVSP